MVASSGNESLAQAEKGIYHARKAVLLGCVAVGAVFSGDQGSAGAYMQRAQMHLKDCFDSLLPEVGRGAVVALPLCCFFFQFSFIRACKRATRNRGSSLSRRFVRPR